MYWIVHTSTQHIYKSGFSTQKAADIYLRKNKNKLKKYLPAANVGGTFKVQKEG